MNSALAKTTPDAAKITVAETVGPFRDWLKLMGMSPRTIDRHLTTVERWMHDMQVENVSTSAITAKTISGWINRKADGTGFSTRNNDLSSLKSLFSLMCARGWLEKDPSRGIHVDPSIAPDSKEHGARRPFTPREIESLEALTKREDKKNLPPDTCGFWTFAICVGLRCKMPLGDIAQLEWDSFDTTGKISVNGRHYDAVPELTRLCTKVPVEHTKWMFPEQRAIAVDINRRSGLSVSFQRLAQKAGIRGKSFNMLAASSK